MELSRVSAMDTYLAPVHVWAGALGGSVIGLATIVTFDIIRHVADAKERAARLAEARCVQAWKDMLCVPGEWWVNSYTGCHVEILVIDGDVVIATAGVGVECVTRAKYGFCNEYDPEDIAAVKRLMKLHK